MFSVPPVHATVLAQPELMGMSAGGTFVVTDDAVAEDEVPALLASLRVQPALPASAPVVECETECAPGAWRWRGWGQSQLLLLLPAASHLRLIFLPLPFLALPPLLTHPTPRRLCL